MQGIQTLQTASILVVEDDPHILELIEYNLASAGFLVKTAGTILDARAALERFSFDLLVIDVRLPDGNGMEFARDVTKTSAIGIIIMTGSGDEIDRIIGLELGADDYINKPFHQRELVARARAVLRRSRSIDKDKSEPGSDSEVPCIQFHEYSLNKSNRSVIDVNGEPVSLTSKEFDVLLVLAENKNIVLSRSKIHADAGLLTADLSRGVDGLISRLRKKLFSNNQPHLRIKTVHGRGYVLTE